jgi:hypothetical protein
VIFAPDAMSEAEARTNSRDSFAAIREVDTRQPTHAEIRRLMSAKPSRRG